MKRAPEVVGKYLRSDERAWYTTRPCKVVFPVRYEEKSLATIAGEVSCYALVMFLFDTGEYLVLNALSTIQLKPQKVETITIDGDDYYALLFLPGDKLFNKQVVKSADLIYPVMDEVWFRAKIPFYVEDTDIMNIPNTALTHAGSGVASAYEVFELMTAAISLDKKDPSKKIRHTAKSEKDFKRDNVRFAGLANVFFSVNSTLSRLNGAGFEDAVVSSLVKPAVKSDLTEQILRS